MRPALHAVLALFLLNGALFGSWAARIPAFKERFALSPDALGVLLLCLAGGAILAFPAAGRIIDRQGPELLSKILAVAYCLALPALAAAPDPIWLAVTLLVFGACFGAMDVAMNAWGAEVETARGKPLLPQLHAVFSLGAGLGAAGGGLAVAAGLGPLGHFTLVALALGILTVPFALRAPASPRPPAAADVGAPAARGPVLPTGALLLVGLIAGGTGLSEAAVADWSAVYLRVVTEAPPSIAALGFAAFSTTMVIVRLSGGWIVERLGAVQATRLSGLCLALGTGIVVLATASLPTLGGFAVMGCGAALVMPLAFARAAADPRVAPGTAIAQVALIGYGGLLLGPPLIGFIAARSDYPTAFLLLLALGLLVALLAPALRAPLEADRENHEVTEE
ncbi:MAG: MFS transporter [Pseudomonadota bacterium]